MSTATTTLVIDRNAAIRGLRAAVAEKGAGYIYRFQFPAYVTLNDNGTLWPACLVGWALHHLGVPLKLMTPRNTAGINTLAWHLRSHDIHITKEAIQVFMAAQEIQDRSAGNQFLFTGALRKTWGAALTAAEAVADGISQDRERALVEGAKARANAAETIAQEAAIHAAVDQLEAEVAAAADKTLVPA